METRAREEPARYGKSAAPFEERLKNNFEYALEEGSMFFNQRGQVHAALKKITERLDALGIDYALAGVMALFLHGYQRLTDDVNVLVRPEGLKRIHEELEGRGYLPPFAGSRNLRDTENGVKVEFLVTGGFPVDGNPKPIAFPDPAAAHTTIHGIRCLTLPVLIELKLASGMTNPTRAQDLGDVVALIRERKLGTEFSRQLNAYVRTKFVELVDAVAQDEARGEI